MSFESTVGVLSVLLAAWQSAEAKPERRDSPHLYLINLAVVYQHTLDAISKARPDCASKFFLVNTTSVQKLADPQTGHTTAVAMYVPPRYMQSSRLLKPYHIN